MNIVYSETKQQDQEKTRYVLLVKTSKYKINDSFQGYIANIVIGSCC